MVDLVPIRNTEEVKNWLAKYPNIEVISRDGAQIYANVLLNENFYIKFN